jgi:hypothetical protein
VAPNKRRLIKKRGTPKYKGLQIKTFNEKRNTPKHKGLRPKIFNEKRGTLKKFKGLKRPPTKKKSWFLRILSRKPEVSVLVRRFSPEPSFLKNG